jgi:hypothetical protein
MWEPEAEKPNDFDEDGRVMLPPEYAGWLASGENTLGDLAALQQPGSLRIVAPVPGTIYFVDPDLPERTQRVPLKAQGNGVEWQCDTLPLEAEGSRTSAALRAGRHIITARNRQTGERSETWIEVRAL